MKTVVHCEELITLFPQGVPIQRRELTSRTGSGLLAEQAERLLVHTVILLG